MNGLLKSLIVKTSILCAAAFIAWASHAQSNTNPALFNLSPETVEYVGGFRIPLSTKGESRIAYSQGVFALRPNKNAFFIVGHSHHQGIAELEIPELSKSKTISDWNFATFNQPFSLIIPRASSGNPQKINRITGMKEIEGQLIVNGMEYYDGDANVRDTTLIVREADHLERSKIDGFFQLQGAAHAAGWISEIPALWRKELNSEYLVGNASALPINSRLSIGPTAFTAHFFGVLNSEEKSGLILTDSLMDFSLKHPIVPDQYNKSLKNNLWTELSAAHYGFIIPNTSSYLVIGKSGGHNSGIGYKITQDNGRECGGPCSVKAGDSYNYFWLFDVADFVSVKSGKKQPYQPQPYQFGFFDTVNTHPYIIGADYSNKTELLYVVYSGEDKYQSQYEAAPVVRVYKIRGK
ncbi:hypothetical protein [Paraglaciecola chathamensis]|uniref:Uncharacterized protein n=1 Tax=Paraglaciecola chathamensis TaxID=368405 RepID=A0A8H9IE53_9ALTE|nr:MULTISPECIES: hypothetical protein [Paraglaciecola]MBJ2134982.1 hypothetical protein [Paraglaciecola chathamensis]GGZ65684.1 hypothetical protein GCM10011274_24990 [Paraglaciecola oceanifecundans]